ncbi:uncharacterized protein LOC127368569 [Scomber scombrus]|uniref:Uncharacterized protein LOC127368569 n=1 Tax=Scomber scombrus TaxID=13677 RepID=A0AAV1Q5T8_SCOSC
MDLNLGDNATLPCNRKSSSACSTVNWLYSRDESQTSVVVENGKVKTRASRLSLGTNCSLVINDISARDGGRYTCQQSTELDIVLNLNIIMPGSTTHLYHRPEDSTTLPCRGASLSDRACSTVDWIYNRDVSQSFELVQKGQVVKESGRAARLSLGMNCSLLINGVTAEDAGFYTCDQKYILNTGVLLSVLTSISGQRINLFNRPGDDVILPSDGASVSDSDCSTVTWLYNRDLFQATITVIEPNVRRQSVRAARLSMDTNCSLLIKNITDEDAGLYNRRQANKVDIFVNLNILTIRPSPPDADAKGDGNITLRCTLLSYDKCRANSIRWSGPNRTFTCQKVDERNNVQIEDHYTPFFTHGFRGSPPKESNTGISGQRINLFNRPGDDVILPSDGASVSDSDCSTVTWLYNRDEFQATIAVIEPNVRRQSVRAARLSLDTDCSLLINNITDEDAGRYIRQQANKVDIIVNLNILTITPSPPDADPKGDGNITLRCTLLSFDKCRANSIRWVDETGSVLRGEGLGYKVTVQKDCASVLTVTRQIGPNRKYTCQRVDEMNNVQIEDHYTPVFKDHSPDMKAVVVVVLLVVVAAVVVVIITAVFIKFRKRDTTSENGIQNTVNPPDPHQPQDEPSGSLTYVTVNHANQKTTSKKKVTEEQVTYSTVKTPVNTKADTDPNSIYYNINW